MNTSMKTWCFGSIIIVNNRIAWDCLLFTVSRDFVWEYQFEAETVSQIWDCFCTQICVGFKNTALVSNHLVNHEENKCYNPFSFFLIFTPFSYLWGWHRAWIVNSKASFPIWSVMHDFIHSHFLTICRQNNLLALQLLFCYFLVSQHGWDNCHKKYWLQSNSLYQ